MPAFKAKLTGTGDCRGGPRKAPKYQLKGRTVLVLGTPHPMAMHFGVLIHYEPELQHAQKHDIPWFLCLTRNCARCIVRMLTRRNWKQRAVPDWRGAYELCPGHAAGTAVSETRVLASVSAAVSLNMETTSKHGGELCCVVMFQLSKPWNWMTTTARKAGRLHQGALGVPSGLDAAPRAPQHKSTLQTRAA